MDSFDGLFSDDLVPAPLSLAGDFYREPDDVCRGVTFTDLGFDSIDTLQGSWDALKVIDAPSSLSSFQKKVHRFEELKAGRKVPDDPFFYLENTTQYLPEVPPSKAGNHVLDFLEQEIPSSITKVNDQKFSIKAEAFHDGLSCLIKVYIYQQESGCAVEFQRRSGDTIAFWGIYKKASEYLCEHTASHRLQLSPKARSATASPVVPGHLGLKSQGVECALADSSVGAEAKDHLTMLLEMPRQASYQQDEIATIVYGILEEEDMQKLAEWCKPEAFEMLLELLATDRFTAAYPAALLLTRLADLPEARSHFLSQGLLKSVLLHLWVQATGPALWLQLTHFVHSVVSKYAAHMTGKEFQEAESAIVAALQSEPLDEDPTSSGRTACVGQRLREALYMLGADLSKASQSSLMRIGY